MAGDRKCAYCPYMSEDMNSYICHYKSSHPGEQIKILIPKSDKETEYCIMNYNISIDDIGPHSVIFDDNFTMRLKYNY